MKSFDPNYIYRFSKKTIKLTFQQWEYRGIAFVEIGGNCTFVDMLSDFQDGDTLLSLLKQKTSRLDFDFEDLGQTGLELFCLVIQGKIAKPKII